MDIVTKKCAKCEEVKVVDQFNKNKAHKDGMNAYCRTCDNLLNKKYYAQNKSRINQRDKEYYLGNKEKRRIRAAVYRKRNKDKVKDNLLRKTYGIDIEKYKSMCREQGGVCAICKHPNTLNRDLVVDHCHVSGKVRGLLCGKCNSALGLLRESTIVVMQAYRYLEEYSSGSQV